MDEDLSNRASVSLTDSTYRGSVGGSDNVADLRKQIMTLQADNEGFRRAIPIMKDLEGHDVTKKMTTLAADLAKSHQIIEDWEKRYAKQEKDFYEFKKKTHDELTARENNIDRLRERAKALEIDNEKLRKQLEDDESKIFHLQQQNHRYSEIGGENESLNIDDFNQSYMNDSNHRQELIEKIEENVQLANQVAELQKTIDELRTVVNEQSKALKNVIVRDLDGREDSLFTVALDNPTQYSGTDYVIAQMLGLLEQLEVNDHDSNTLRESIVKFLRDRGYDAENKNIAELAMSFRTAFNNRRKQIRATNEELANEYRQNNTELRRHLNQLSDDSICSSVALSVQQTANESRALDMSRADILNKTADVTQNLTTVVSRMNVLRGVCNDLFSKLQGTAEFLQNLLDGLDEDDDEGKELMKKIKNIRLDLDKSMGEAMLLVDEVKKAEKTISEFQSILGQTFDLTQADESQEQGDVDADTIREEFRKEIDRLKGVEDRNVSLSASLNQEIKLKKEAQSEADTLKKQLRDIEEQLNEKTQELQIKLNEHEQTEAQLQSTIEELNHSVNKLCGELDCKSQALVDAQNEHQHMRECLDDARNTVEIVRQKLSATQAKYNEVMEAMKKHSNDVQGRDHDIQEMTQKLDCLREQLQFTISERNEKVDLLEAKLNDERRRRIDLDKINESLNEKCHLLETELEQLRTELQHTNAIVEKGNDVFLKKLQEGFEDMDTSSIEEEDGEQVANFDEFVNFLDNCKDRAHTLVQLVKKAEETASKTNITLPYCDEIINELRSLRMMLHKIAKFFDANKENLGRNTKSFAEKIKKELVNIHATLQDVASQNFAPMPRCSAKVKETGGQKLEKRKK
ncbi:hypothetical protein DdX_01701 [Ditylenchus destructor]|uniref:Uncharacterized protein n=1 Tax=Ditylenchus destructor TaxID=166010 RepID=A0AAD4NMB0_9BILA|nr:hypothetical protein DdX_01701 [Ditylenchus destructor]